MVASALPPLLLVPASVHDPCHEVAISRWFPARRLAWNDADRSIGIVSSSWAGPGSRPAPASGLGTQQRPPPTDSRNPHVPRASRSSSISLSKREQTPCQRARNREHAARRVLAQRGGM